MRWSESAAVRWEQKRARGKPWYVARHTLSYGLGISLIQFAVDQFSSDLIDFGWVLVVINLALGSIIGLARWAHGESHYREALGTMAQLNADQPR